MDPYFDKPPTPRGPLLSDAAVICLCATMAVGAFLWFAASHPEEALQLIALAVLGIVILLTPR
jgi:hypothetical protein